MSLAQTGLSPLASVAKQTYAVEEFVRHVMGGSRANRQYKAITADANRSESYDGRERV